MAKSYSEGGSLVNSLFEDVEDQKGVRLANARDFVEMHSEHNPRSLLRG